MKRYTPNLLIKYLIKEFSYSLLIFTIIFSSLIIFITYIDEILFFSRFINCIYRTADMYSDDEIITNKVYNSILESKKVKTLDNAKRALNNLNNFFSNNN